MSTAPDYTMTDYVVADAGGRIGVHGTIPAFMLASQVLGEGEQVALGRGTRETHYVASGALLVRPPNSATLDGMTLKNLPVPCTVTVEGVAHDCTDDHCDLSFSHAGTFAVTVSAFPMLDATFEVTQA
jgi:hypothetical protein